MFATFGGVEEHAVPRPPRRPSPPVASARPLSVAPVLAGLLPDGGLRRGSVVAVAGAGWCSLLLAVVAGPLGEGSWGAVVGLPSLGAEAADGLGVRLDRLALVPEPGPRWTEVVGALLDAVEVVAVVPPGRCRPGETRRLVARARERHGVLVVADPPPFGSAGLAAGRWPGPVDLWIEAVPVAWRGLDRGDGRLESREVAVRSYGRRAGGRERRATLWLPAADGGLATGAVPAATVPGPSLPDGVRTGRPGGQEPDGQEPGRLAG